MPDLARRESIGTWLRAASDPWPVARDMTVLLVSRDPTARNLHRSILEDAGYAVAELDDGQEALAFAERTPVDVIVLDASCAQDEMVAAAHALNGSRVTHDIPLLAMVGPDEGIETPGRLESAVDDFLITPVRQWEVLVRIRSLIQLRHHRQELLNHRSLHGEQTRMWEVLLEFTRAVPAMKDLDVLLERIVHTATIMTSSRRVSLMLPDDKQENLTIVKSIGLDSEHASGAKVPIGDAIAGRAYRSGKAVTTLDDNDELAQREGFDFQTFVSMPMIYTTMSMVHQRVGVINVADRYGDRPFEEWELEFVDLLGSIAASAIDEIHSRETRESLLKMESDLQLAKKIQRATFPQRLPALHGFEIDAWSEPADQTAGDTYDVIGYRSDEHGNFDQFCDDDANRVILLLADATGHGIGPALSVTQVRSMLRMAVRMQTDLVRIACHMNEQLCLDLPGGRFVTTWLGDLDATDGTLISVSAGQAPILHYRADRDEFVVMAADTMPLGIVTPLVIRPIEPIRMAPGDIVAVISDGLLEATNPDGQHFGDQRALDVIAANQHLNPTRIRTALRRAVGEFTGPAPLTDDRTAIIIKRTPFSHSDAA